MGNPTTLTLNDLPEIIRSLPPGHFTMRILIKKTREAIKWLLRTENLDLQELVWDIEALSEPNSEVRVTVNRDVSTAKLRDGTQIPITGHIKVTLG
jgi:hypothetical protein